MNNYKVIQTIVNKNTSTEESENEESSPEEKLRQVDWNCFSTISPKNIILQSRQFANFNTAAVVFTPPEISDPFISLSHIEIQKSIDFYFRSLITMTKEIINDLGKRTQANLYLILNSQNKEEMFTAVYKAFISSALQNSTDSLLINGVENSFQDPELFADYFYNILQKEKKSGGKWFRQHQMNSLFSPFSGKR